MNGRLTCGLLLVFSACQRAPRTAATTAPTERERLRDQARLVLESHCGQCHISGYATALPGALRVFDLLEPEWSAHMTDAQLRNALWRLGEPLPPEGQPNDVTPSERAVFQKFLESEMLERSKRPIHCS